MSKKGRPKNKELTVRDMRSWRADLELYRRVQACCYWRREVFSHVLEDLLLNWVVKQEQKHNQGEPFSIPDTEEFEAMTARLEKCRAARQED